MRLEYLRKLAEKGQLWPRHQEAEREQFQDAKGVTRTALVTMAETEQLKRMSYFKGSGWGDGVSTRHVLIASVSHCWEAQQHPDPWGYQLRCLLHKIDGHCSKAVLDTFDFWVFIDFMCLPQHKRLDQEQYFFQQAMRSMHILYAHTAIARVFRLEDLTPETERVCQRDSIEIYCEQTGKFEARPFSELILNDTPYFQRGWCVAEVQWMGTKTAFWGRAPMRPAVFCEQVKQGEKGLPGGLSLKFTHRSDADIVVRLQELVFMLKANERSRITAYDLPPEEVQVLSETLPHFKNLAFLHVEARFSDAAAAALFSAMLANKSLRRVKLHGLDDGHIAGLGAETLASAIRNLHRLWLHGEVADAGAALYCCCVLGATSLEEELLLVLVQNEKATNYNYFYLSLKGPCICSSEWLLQQVFGVTLGAEKAQTM